MLDNHFHYPALIIVLHVGVHGELWSGLKNPLFPTQEDAQRYSTDPLAGMQRRVSKIEVPLIASAA